MVKRFFFLFCLNSLFLFSGEFVARVDQNKVYLGETFTLSLTLKGASAKDYPSTRVLKNAFFIQSQQQASNTTILNGSATSSTTWKIALIPQDEGKWEIPSISITTSDGVLSTSPIVIEVIKGTSSNLSNVDGVEFTATLSNQKPYKNEPFLYTLKLTSSQTLANLQLEKIQIEDAIIEPQGEPKISNKILNGVHFDVAEFNYLVTPLKSGELTIHSAMIQGGIPSRRRGYGNQSLDPFLMMNGYDRLEPFSLKSQEFHLDVQPAVPGVSPWLPANSLKIEEIFDEKETLQVGNPFTRIFKIEAEGVKSDQIPSLESQVKGTSFKTYADHPELKDELKFGRIQSSRKEQYTLIPQEDGSLILPEISLVWWDVKAKEKRIVTVPERVLNVQPLPQETKPLAPVEQKTVEVVTEVVSKKDPVLYAIIIGLGALLLAAAALGFFLYRKLAKLTQDPGTIKKVTVPKKKKARVLKKDKKEKLPDLNPT